jgi:hypothetical protein
MAIEAVAAKLPTLRLASLPQKQCDPLSRMSSFSNAFSSRSGEKVARSAG